MRRSNTRPDHGDEQRAPGGFRTGDADRWAPRATWVRPLLIGLLVLYLGGYAAVRRAHLLVNYDGHRGWFGVRLFDTSGVVMPHALPIGTALGLGQISVVIFVPLHRLETLVRHGPIHACRSW